MKSRYGSPKCAGYTGCSRSNVAITNDNNTHGKAIAFRNCAHLVHFIATILFATIMIVNVRHSCGLIEIQTEKEKHVRTIDVQAVEGNRISLPCPLIPPSRDKVYMVLWFRDDAGIPLYSFDVRGRPLNDAQHWSAPETFGSRARFNADVDPATLDIKNIKRHDQGIYRCRVDFRTSQTQSFRYNLTIIIPPEYPLVLNRWGHQLNGTILGPMEEGDDIVLTCRVTGGRPQPQVRWLVNGVLVDDQYEHNTGDVIENRLLWPAVQRSDLNAIFTCQAVNTILVEPKENSYVLDLHLKPLTVDILDTPMQLVAERRYEIKCESNGSRPNAIITWYKGKRQLRRTRDETVNTTSRSELSFVPSTEDDGKSITCRAENPKVTGLFLETTWKLNVVYPPIVTLRLGSTLSDNIKEGDDVYFECLAVANPQWRKLYWLHDGVVLTHNASARVIRSNQSLVLQRVTRHSAGNYSCSAINAEGETVSNQLELRVKYAPLCVTDKVVIVGAFRNENLNIYCEVQADPPPRSFRWKFNNSGETLDVGKERHHRNGSTSILQYTPVTDQVLSAFKIQKLDISRNKRNADDSSVEEMKKLVDEMPTETESPTATETTSTDASFHFNMPTTTQFTMQDFVTNMNTYNSENDQSTESPATTETISTDEPTTTQLPILDFVTDLNTYISENDQSTESSETETESPTTDTPNTESIEPSTTDSQPDESPSDSASPSTEAPNQESDDQQIPSSTESTEPQNVDPDNSSDIKTTTQALTTQPTNDDSTSNEDQTENPTPSSNDSVENGEKVDSQPTESNQPETESLTVSEPKSSDTINQNEQQPSNVSEPGVSTPASDSEPIVGSNQPENIQQTTPNTNTDSTTQNSQSTESSQPETQSSTTSEPTSSDTTNQSETQQPPNVSESVVSTPNTPTSDSEPIVGANQPENIQPTSPNTNTDSTTPNPQPTESSQPETKSPTASEPESSDATNESETQQPPNVSEPVVSTPNTQPPSSPIEPVTGNSPSKPVVKQAVDTQQPPTTTQSTETQDLTASVPTEANVQPTSSTSKPQTVGSSCSDSDNQPNSHSPQVTQTNPNQQPTVNTPNSQTSTPNPESSTNGNNQQNSDDSVPETSTLPIDGYIAGMNDYIATNQQPETQNPSTSKPTDSNVQQTPDTNNQQNSGGSAPETSTLPIDGYIAGMNDYIATNQQSEAPNSSASEPTDSNVEQTPNTNSNNQQNSGDSVLGTSSNLPIDDYIVGMNNYIATNQQGTDLNSPTNNNYQQNDDGSNQQNGPSVNCGQTVPSNQFQELYPVQGPPYSSDAEIEALIEFAFNNYPQYEQTIQSGQRPPSQPCSC